MKSAVLVWGSLKAQRPWKRPWCWEGLRAGGEGGDRGWGGWMASLTRWAWVWVNSGSWWWTGRPDMLLFMGSQRVGHDWATELNWTERLHPLTAPLGVDHAHGPTHGRQLHTSKTDETILPLISTWNYATYTNHTTLCDGPNSVCGMRFSLNLNKSIS